MDKLPFTSYDFFGNLSAGFIFLAGVAAACSGTDDWRSTPGAISALILVISAYVAGQVIAHLGAFMFERLLVRRWLRTPTQNLLEPVTEGFGPTVLPGYYGPLPEAQRRALLNRVADEASIETIDDGLFVHCWLRVKDEPPVAARLSNFLNLYGFSRNMAFALALTAVVLTAGSIAGTAHTGDIASPGWWALASLIAAVGLLYRYLKFFRHYAYEVFTSYLNLRAP